MNVGPIVVGTGPHRYVVEPAWARLPDGAPFGIVCGVAVDGADRVYVYARGPRPVTVFAPDGRFLGSWGEDLIWDAHGIHVGHDDAVYLTDRDAHEVLKCTLDGAVLLRLGTRGVAALEAPFNHPTAVAVAPDGELYVTDGYANSRVHRFAADGRHLASWGAPGSGPGEFRVPHGVWVTRSGRVIVCDRDNLRVQVFDRDGRHLATWADFFRPTSVFQDADGVLYVTDLSSRLTVMHEDGTILTRIRIMVDGGHAVWGNRRGDLFVAEIHQGRIDRYRRL